MAEDRPILCVLSEDERARRPIHELPETQLTMTTPALSSNELQATAQAVARRHFGVYGAYLERGRVLAVRKTRGPYTGQLDLPGGTPEGQEQFSETLERELAEETGGRVVVAGSWNALDVLVKEHADGSKINFHHVGVWCTVLLADVDHDLPPHEDVCGLEWVHIEGWQERDDLSAPLRQVLDTIAL